MTRQCKLSLLAAAVLAIVAVSFEACDGAKPPDEGASAASGQTSGVTPDRPAGSGSVSNADQGDGSAADASAVSVPLFAPYDRDKIAPMFGELAEDFQGLPELTAASSVIAVGEVVDTEYAPYQNIPFTIVTLRVERPVKGDVKEGDHLRIVETGGVFAGRSKEKPGEFGQPVEAAFEGVPVMKTGDRWLLFLGPYDPGPVATGAYSVKGVFQGKLRIAEDRRIMFTGDPARVDEPLFTVPRQTSGRALSAVLADIQAALGP